ncbi:hypothetical protein BAUCODRAFT_507951 [Baudoinia panamericana UAMH 10762]|uniref:Transcriptional regulator n=1 Tax=Baudoinia panamericana (strain UAMH 10762) TaxID=717646 RepID=M2MWG8_BAUPA|nr:uncharacterized protein BAUCODRAFT_507951 [Baudoinia panamericana UAMH 10762]EMC95893.1 hypothetical protein BAUCODRAFT_507951 [Baudoinia panamericana UAMH 10762]
MSDSGLSTPGTLPPDTEIEQCLRRIVRNALKADEEISTNIARSRAEAELGLGIDFFKDDATWKQRSKEIISIAFNDPPSPEKAKKTPRKLDVKPQAKAPKKRKSSEVESGKRKKRKGSSENVIDESDADEDAEPRVIAEAERNGNSTKPPASIPESDDDDEKPVAQYKAHDESRERRPEAQPRVNVNGVTGEAEESELSSVLDEPVPAKKKRQKKSTSPSDTRSKPKKAPKAEKEVSPDEEEIKRLQGWLVKCGIRKVWGKELKPFDTANGKIKHLKGMLEDVGMKGRYSVEKAKQIKEARELAADLENVKEFNDRWGQKGSDDEDEDDGKTAAPPKRLRPKGLIDFGDSGDDDSA